MILKSWLADSKSLKYHIFISYFLLSIFLRLWFQKWSYEKINVNCQGKVENRDDSHSEYLDDSYFIVESTLVPSSHGA